MSYVKREDVNYCDIEIFRDNEKVPELFQDLWVARLSTMRVVFTNHFGGGIKPECKVEIDGKTRVTSGNVIETYLQYSGKPVEVTCIADYGSFQVRKSTTIDVRKVYEEPKLAPAVKNATDIVCGRCTENGTLNPQGENLYLNAVRVYSPVSALDGTDQRNFCRMRLRYKTSTGEYGEWITVLDADDPVDEVKEIVPGINLSKRNTYTVQVGVVDDTGAEHTLTRQIPATAVAPFHLGNGGKNVGIGQFCDYSHSEAVDFGWQAFFNAGIGVRKLIEERTDVSWYSGQRLSEIMPDLDQTPLANGTLFFALVEQFYTYGSPVKIAQMQAYVLCTKSDGMICGSGIGCYEDDSDYTGMNRQYTATVRITDEDGDGDYQLMAYMMPHNAGGSHGNLEPLTDGKGKVTALYVLL